MPRYKRQIYRIINSLKLIFSYLLSILIKRPIHWGMPFGISVEPTNQCNLSCPQCPTGMHILTRQEGKMEINLLKKVMDELSPYLFSTIFYFQGEPFLNRDIYDMIDYSRHKGIYSITSTNAHFINDSNTDKIINSGLKKLIVSMDGITQEIYEKYRINGSLNKVIEAIRLLVGKKLELKSELPEIVIQFLVTSQNEHQISGAKRLAKALNANKIDFKTIQIYDYQFGNALMPANEKFSRYKKMPDGTYRIKSNLKNRCWRMWSNPVITVSGDVVPCCFDKDARYKMGNLKNQTFKEIWNSDIYKDFRAKIFKNRKSIDICENCTEGLTKIFF